MPFLSFSLFSLKKSLKNKWLLDRGGDDGNLTRVQNTVLKNQNVYSRSPLLGYFKFSLRTFREIH